MQQHKKKKKKNEKDRQENIEPRMGGAKEHYFSGIHPEQVVLDGTFVNSMSWSSIISRWIPEIMELLSISPNIG